MIKNKINTVSYSYPLFFVLLLLLSGCSTSTKNLTVYHQPKSVIIDQTFPKNGLSIQYLGVGGHLFRFENHAIMTAPSITNPHFLTLGPFIPINPDFDLIDALLPEVGDVETILVGHAHYDHLMDVPYVMQHKAQNAKVYGSNTMSHTLAPVIPPSRRFGLNDSMAIEKKPGEWHYNTDRSIRFMAIKSTHAPHFLGINIMTGTYEEDLTSLPWHAFGWKEGQTLSFLIDFLDNNEVIQHRIYYQDAASQEPLGLLPELKPEDQKPVDIAIITPASFNQVDNYPESIMKNTQAKHFILGHWEDFFDNQEQAEQRFVRAVSPTDFFNRFNAALPKNSTWAMPSLFSTQYFAPNGIILGSDQLEH